MKQTSTRTTENAKRVLPIPDALPQRADIETSERWRVTSAPPIRGACSTNFATRSMSAPDEYGYTAAAVRAHEITHAGFSPQYGADTLAPLFDVTPEALAAAEEWRVIALAERAGVSMEHLTDETEKSAARLAAIRKDWRAALILTAQTFGTGAERKVTTTITKHAPPEWKKPLMQFRRTLRSVAKPWALQSMAISEHMASDGTALKIPDGFLYSVHIARHIDAHTRSNPTKSDEKRAAEARQQQQRAEADNRRERVARNRRKFTREPQYSEKGSPYEHVRLMQSDLDERQTGRLATKRTASSTGKKPRRMSRVLTDPQRRVFDKRTRTNGGVIVVDMSGSMHLDDSEVDSILKAAGGATVLGYSNVGSGYANVFLIAHNGERTAEFPEAGGNNDVDAPALRYAASLRKNKREPFIWVTDGRAYHDGGAFSIEAARELDALIRKHRIHIAPNPEQAVKELKRCARGNVSPMKHSPFIEERLRDAD